MRHLLLTAVVIAALTTTCFAHGGGGGHGGGHGGHGGHGGRISIIAVPTYTQRIVIIHLARCEALNVQVTVPSESWKKVDPQAIGSHTNFMLTRHNPEITISLAAERVGVEAKDTNRTLLAASQAKMKSLPGATILPGERQLSGQNIQGVSYQASAEQDGRAAHYAIWVASRNGYNYKLAVYGEQKYKPAIDAAMRNFVYNMRQMDSKRIAHTESKLKIAEHYLDATEKSASKEPLPFAEPLVK
jgi:hypothetical protein